MERLPIQDETRLTDYGAERIVIAGVMRAPDLNVRRVRFVLKDSDFCWVHHGWLYAKCVERWYTFRESPIRLDAIFGEVCNLRGSRIHRRDFGANAGQCLWDIYESDPTGAWCIGAAMRVRELAERRRIIHAARIRIRDAMDGVVRV